jgi:hypothetical protein
MNLEDPEIKTYSRIRISISISIITRIMTAATSTTKRVNISISNVAPLIGLDHYNNFPRILCELWRRYDPEGFRSFEIRMKEQGIRKLANSSEMNDIWEIDDTHGTNILEQVKKINNDKDKTSGDMVKLQEIVIKELDKIGTMAMDVKMATAQKICSITNKMHGVNNEDNILEEFCRLSEKTISNTQGWVEIPLVKDDIEFVIVGKYDAITSDGELVEAKMRQKGLFKKMRDYENIQVQLYLHALEYEHGYLIEGYKKTGVKNTGVKNTGGNKPVEMQIYLHEINRDDYYISEVILDRLKKLTTFFKVFIQNEGMKETIIQNDPNRKIYNLYITEYLELESGIDM